MGGKVRYVSTGLARRRIDKVQWRHVANAGFAVSFPQVKKEVEDPGGRIRPKEKMQAFVDDTPGEFTRQS